MKWFTSPLFARLQFLCSYSILEEKQENDPIYRQGFLFLKPPPSTIDHSMAKLGKMYKICIPELFVCHLISGNNFFFGNIRKYAWESTTYIFLKKLLGIYISIYLFGSTLLNGIGHSKAISISGKKEILFQTKCHYISTTYWMK